MTSNIVRNPDSSKSFINISIILGCVALTSWIFSRNISTQKLNLKCQTSSFSFKEWRESIMGESYESGKPPFLLSTIAYFAPKIFPPNNDKAYPFKAIKDNVDFVNLVCYDYYGSRDFYVTTEHALLYDLKCRNSTHYGISSWINDIGILEGKLVMGLPLYGRTWKAFINPTFSGFVLEISGFVLTFWVCILWVFKI